MISIGKEIKVKLTLMEEILGMAPSSQTVYSDYIASQAPDAKSIEEEIEALGVDEVADLQKNIFPRDKDGNPILWDYQIKGFFKDACGSLRFVSGSQSKALKAYKKKIDGLVFIKERQIPITYEGDLGACQRTLRIATPKGDRTALANAETIPAGATLEFTIQMLDKDLEKTIIEWLDYGAYRGLGQWRNSGKGRFTWVKI